MVFADCLILIFLVREYVQLVKYYVLTSVAETPLKNALNLINVQLLQPGVWIRLAPHQMIFVLLIFCVKIPPMWCVRMVLVFLMNMNAMPRLSALKIIPIDALIMYALVIKRFVLRILLVGMERTFVKILFVELTAFKILVLFTI